MSQKLSDLAAAEERRQSVQDTAANFLRREWSLARLRDVVERDGLADAPGLWRGMRTLGWDRIEPVGEDFSAAELCALAEETGFAMAPTPLVPCVVGRALLRTSPAAAGAELPVLAHIEPGRSTDPLHTATLAVATAAGYRLDGEKRFVPYGAQADLLVVPARLENRELALFAVDADAAHLERKSLDLLDASPCAALRLVEVAVPAGALLASGQSARQALAEAVAFRTVAYCAELVGVATRALQLAIEYAGVREAFGRPIGSYQAVQHRLVDLRGGIEVARALYQGAAARIGGGAGDFGPAVAMAAFAALDELRKVPEGALQVFGGIGTTWEHDIHFLLRRAATLCAVLGERSRFVGEVAQHLAGDATAAGRGE
jgi:alkylation response protein AidB-like acyl-CoA dehydrogenase